MQLFDLHQDLLLHIEHPEYFTGAPQTGWELLEAADVRTLFATAFPVPENGDWYDRRLNDVITSDFESYHQAVSDRADWSVIQTREQLDSAYRGIILHIEGLNTIEDTADDWALLERWYRQGWRSLGIVWNKSNALGGGTERPGDSLTDFGEKVIAWCLERGMVIDCAHMNRRTFAETAALLEDRSLPILVSHGNADALCPTERNYTDEQIERIARSGGVLGVFFSGSYVSPRNNENTIERVADHLDYIRGIGGDEVVALGTDLGGVTKGVPRGLENITKVQDLLGCLRDRGWSQQQLELLASANANRVVRTYFQINQNQS